MAKNKSKAELEADIKYLRRSRIADVIVPIAMSTVRWGGMGLISYFSYLSIAVIAGKETNADIKVNILSNLFTIDFLSKWPVAVGISGVFFGFCGILYGIFQRKLRMATVKRIQSRNKELEQRIDPVRTSSMLTEKGETRLEDR